VESGGTTTVSATVSGARTCKLSASKPVSGLPATFACEGEPAAVSRQLTMPANTGATDATYKLTLAATGVEGKVKAKTSVNVRPQPETATQVASGHEYSCALMSTGQVDCWGNKKDHPVGVGRIDTASQVAAGYHDPCAVLSTGHVHCWGQQNEDGQLGDGTRENADKPVEGRASSTLPR
jgi:hypothetical protein